MLVELITILMLHTQDTCVTGYEPPISTIEPIEFTKQEMNQNGTDILKGWKEIEPFLKPEHRGWDAR